MEKKTDKKIVTKAKASKGRKNISRKRIVSDVKISRRIRIACERTFSDRKNVRIPVSFAIPVRVLKREPKPVYSFANVIKSTIFSKRFVYKVIATYLIVAINLFSVISIVGTDALFNDVEMSQGNTFQAGTLDFSINFLMSDGFRTQSQGSWGSGDEKVCNNDEEDGNGNGNGKKDCDEEGEDGGEEDAEKANGSNNSGSYRDEHFQEVFVDGLTIGNEASGYYAHFSTSDAIKKFLPNGGPSVPFLEDYEDPTDKIGALAGQTVALTLNVRFDNFDEEFSLNEGNFEDLYASEFGTPCEKMADDPDMTVGEILAEANSILSGHTSEFIPSEMNECVTEINERFDGGKRTEITPEEFVWREIKINNNGNLNFQHGLRVEKTSGDDELCDALLVQAYLNGVLLYTVNLMDLDYSSAVFSDSTNEWKLFIRLSSDAPSSLSGKTCGFKYVVSGWQEDFNDSDEGFTDVEEISDSVQSAEWENVDQENNPEGGGDDDSDDSDDATTDRGTSTVEIKTDLSDNNGSVVMNEFLPNPEDEEYGVDFGQDESLMPRGEWIELYNNGEIEHDVAGWHFEDRDGNRVEITGDHVLASTIAPSHGWLVVYMNEELLDNKGNETITLFDQDGNEMDSYEYSGKVHTNKSYARIPDGTGEWIDPIPTPGKANILENADGNNSAEINEANEYRSGNGNYADVNNGINIDENSYSIGYLNGETEVVIDNKTGDIVEFVDNNGTEGPMNDPEPPADSGENNASEEGGDTIQAVSPKDEAAGGEMQTGDTDAGQKDEDAAVDSIST